MSAPGSPPVEQVRRFNRTVTRRVGALDDSYLSRDRPLGASRLLWEIGADGREVRELRTRLGLDSGHLSRLLRALEDEALIRVEPAADDRRVRVARLTGKGSRERELLDRASDDLAQSILEPLDPGRREELVSAMATVERLLTLSMVELRVPDPAHPDAERCIRAYFDELDRRSDHAFDEEASRSYSREEVMPPVGAFVVAYLDGGPVGCGAVKHAPGRPAEIKRMWVAEEARGLGLGRRLLAHLESRAIAAGARTLRLDTNRNLVQAIGMYRSSGYEEVPPFNHEPFAHHWFEKRVH
jgi:DNA-binding MarR family transcriptional regulator/GNAT superfamily N-acetyltransferase